MPIGCILKSSKFIERISRALIYVIILEMFIVDSPLKDDDIGELAISMINDQPGCSSSARSVCIAGTESVFV